MHSKQWVGVGRSTADNNSVERWRLPWWREGSRGRFLLLEERGPHRDWSNVEEMGARPKIPASLLALATRMEEVENDAEAVDTADDAVQVAIDSVLAARRRFLCSCAVPRRQVANRYIPKRQGHVSRRSTKLPSEVRHDQRSNKIQFRLQGEFGPHVFDASPVCVCLACLSRCCVAPQDTVCNAAGLFKLSNLSNDIACTRIILVLSPSPSRLINVCIPKGIMRKKTKERNYRRIMRSSPAFCSAHSYRT